MATSNYIRYYRNCAAAGRGWGACQCPACVAKRNEPFDPSKIRRKPKSAETLKKERYESRQNRCDKCFMAKSVTGECMCDE